MAGNITASARLRVQVLSDLHTELDPVGICIPRDVDTGADIVIMAGDMAHAPDSVRMTCDLFPAAAAVISVGGNHEHYGTGMDIGEGLETMQKAAQAESLKSGRLVRVLEDGEAHATIRGVRIRFIGCTLWTDYALFGNPGRDRLRVQGALNDYRMIKARLSPPKALFLGGHGSALSTDEVLARHETSRAFLAAALERTHDGPTIVVTHHLPSMRSVSQRFRRDPVSAGFASRLDLLVEQGAVLWVHGHTHDSCRWRAAGGTLVVCNPAGYLRRSGLRENADFDPRLVIDIRRGAPEGQWRAGIERKHAGKPACAEGIQLDA